MPITTLDPQSALIVIDLQKGVAGFPMVRPLAAVVDKVNILADAFRAKDLPVILVVAERGNHGRAERASRAPDVLPPDFSDLLPELDQGPGDHRIVKHARGAFTHTDLDKYLRGRGVTQLVVTGIATSNGVEMTARQAFDLGYNVTMVLDAMNDIDAETEAYSVQRVFPRIAETGSTEDVVAFLGQ